MVAASPRDLPPLDDALADAAQLAQSFAELDATVLELERRGILGELDELRLAAPQVYLDIVGDAAHALHAYALRGR